MTLFSNCQWFILTNYKFEVTVHVVFAGSQVHTFSSCPNNVHWNDDGLDRDLYIQTTTMTVLAMDGRRRWLDIHKLVSLVKASH
jgi:hypothetical protein